MTDEERIELHMLRQLRKAVNAMLAFTGWEDGCDEDAAAAAIKVRRVVDSIDDAEGILFGSAPTSGEKHVE